MNSNRLLLRYTVAALVALTVMSVAGCPMNQNNTAPVANAGTDQTVAVSSTVTLNGGGSSDADGDTLTFAWSQTAGTNVTLTGANAATATFTAPAAADNLTFQLTVTDGRGGSNTDTMNVTVQVNAPVTTPQLFIANFNGNNITSYQNPSGVNGNIAPDTNLAGAATQLNSPSDIIVDAGGALLVSNFAATFAITGYDDAANSNGNFAPDRNVQGAATLLSQPVSLAVNTASDLLFVANIGTDDVLVFANASTNALNGNLAPTRRIQSADLNNPTGINFGANDDLYVANNGNNNVVVFAGASALNGTVAATRTLTSASFTAVFDVFIDGNDRLYAVNPGGTIDVFNNASTLNGAVTPNSTLTVNGAANLTAIAVDAGNTGYIVDSTNNAVFAYDNIATRNGALNPDRTIQGASTQLATPIRVFLVE